MKHDNNGWCAKCEEILNRYPGFDQYLRNWFTLIHAKFQDFHISCAGRGHDEQETLFLKGATRAHWGQSAHNWNKAFDGFFLIDGEYNLDRARFDEIAKELPAYIDWYGSPGQAFPELPHFENAYWKGQRDEGLIQLVE